MGDRFSGGPPPALGINAWRWPFLLALVLATAAAFPLCGAERGTGELFDWEVFVVGVIVTGVAILSPVRAAAGPLVLVSVAILAGVVTYENVHHDPDVRLAPYLENHASWIAAIAYASLAGLAGWRRADGADASDRNGLLAGLWLLTAGAVIGLVALETPSWLRSNEIFTDHITGTAGGFGGLRRDALALSAVCVLTGGVLVAASVLRRRRRRAFLDGVTSGRVAGWSIERGDDPSLPMFLDPSRRPTGVLVRGGAGAGGPRVARVRG